MNKVFFNKVSIIQSLPNNELNTGSKLKEDIETYNSAYGRKLSIELLDAKNKNEFLSLIKQLKEIAIYEKFYPILHIEAHGSSDQQGIILQSKEFVSWIDLKPYLINLNIATRLNLLVVFSLCHGFHFASQLTPVDRAPCFGLVGPISTLAGPELLRGFSAFYQEVFKSQSAGMALEKLNATSMKDNIKYSFSTATVFFFIAYQNYINSHCTNKSYVDRVRNIRKKLKKESRNFIEIPSIRKLKRSLISSQKEFFETFKLKYFMIDLFPENKNRFIVTYDDIIAYGRKIPDSFMKH
jgi:hypothetical protein